MVVGSAVVLCFFLFVVGSAWAVFATFPPASAATHIETPTGLTFGTITDTSIDVTADGASRLIGSAFFCRSGLGVRGAAFAFSGS